MKSKKKKALIAALVLLGVVSLLRGVISAEKNAVVIQFGIQIFRMFVTAFNLAIIAVAIGVLVCLALFVKQWLDMKKMTEQLEAEEKARSEPEAILSISRDMDARKLYDILTSLASRSQIASEELLRCAMQLKAMDVYQEKLEKLLDNNGAVHLDDTKDVLDRVEQYLCKAVRKVLNYMNVADEQSEKDAEMIIQKLNDCYQDCQAQLDQVKEFMFALAEFLNKQGDNDTTPETLEIYKQSILKSVQEN